MKKQLSLILGIVAIVLLSAISAISQGTITGRLLDASNSEALIAATVTVEGTKQGGTTDTEGKFSVSGVPAGEQTLVISYIGYTDTKLTVTIANGQTVDLGDINLTPSSTVVGEVEIISSIAVDRRTPVAASTLRGAEIEALVGNQEFPEVLRNTPSIYVTKQGGGFGDARINVRGFDQTNVAVMINGIPVNDMENGAVYWSNWAGLSDVTSTMQVQRGLGASKLAVPAVGGSINIITNAADFEKGGAVSVSVGNDGYNKMGLTLSSGQMDNGLALTAQFTQTSGNGYVDGTAFQAYSYFLSGSYKINSKQTIAATVLGAPQWHNQRTLSNFDAISLQTFLDHPQGIRYNPVWGTLNGEEYTWRKNFYHKPKAFINHYWDISEKTSLKTSAYVSLGLGGGTGARGRLRNPTTFDSFSGNDQGIHDAEGQVRFDDIVAYNQGDSITGGGFGLKDVDPGTTNSSGDGFIRRASMNYHTWYGVLSTLDTKLTDNITLTTGIDARYYKGEHFRRLEDLMGNTSYVSRADDNNPNNVITEASPATFGNFLDRSYRDGNNVLNYYNDGLVSWLGVFGQVEYTNDEISAFVSASGSNQGFKRVDYFNYLDSDPNQATEWQNFLGGNIKAGANFNLTATSNVFANAGFFSRQPIFDNVFINFVNDINTDVKNQTTVSFEAGYGYKDAIFDIDVNAYYTQWGNRQFSTSINNAAGETVTYNFNNVAQTHTGLEVEAKAKLNAKISLNGMLSLGNWVYSSDFTGQGTNVDTQTPEGELTLYMNGQKVGDAAQTTLSLGANFYPTKGLSIYANYFLADNLYAQYNILETQFRTAGGTIAQLPAYDLVNAGISYDFDVNKSKVTIRLNANNIMDKIYVSEMFTNVADDADTAENEFYTQNQGFFGAGRTWNASVKYTF